MNVPDHWQLDFENLDEADFGDVTIREDGEVIGTWARSHDVFWAFTPNGAQGHFFFESRLGLLVFKILEWHSAQEVALD